ncbi:MAG: hypothetical protein DIZ77_16785 [endosymbiont of Seepiophila jonesi]|uniref:DUF4129 domain-containing protein n=1 Tax=endosymbiont of Lamellibrachia luymesi TaxID=2200907 RepID=A0A370DV91_9GAMM|nr:MAG: hypothetical protein DIZ79_14685 [endosymbiont of Lamellibrachia luymesi]RDH88889.1 MAG: hypothetical protein DIZ77_16785 [endosymbiont of Seepiophila jonesi]
MDLSRITINLRSRTPWEGADLGFALARSEFLRLWLLWLASALPFYLLLVLLLASEPVLVALLAWWFKPLYEPPLLFWLSRRVFGERLGISEMRQHWWRIVRPQLFANLTWRRFSTARSFNMPVALLEGLKGGERRTRITVLGRGQHVTGWLTFFGINFEILLELSFLVLLVLLIPTELDWLQMDSLIMSESGVEVWLQHIGSLLAMSLIAPFYVAGGFCIYLTRRSELEGWDIELGFKRLAERVKGKRSFSSAAAGLLLMAVGFVLPGESPIAAGLPDREAVQQSIQEVLKDDAFGKREMRDYWEYVGDTDESGEDVPWLLQWLIDFFEGYTQGMATVGEFLLWLAAGLIFAFLLYRVSQMRDWLNLDTLPILRRRQPLPVTLSGLDIRPESLPEDLVRQAEALLLAGEGRAALSLLYRGALSVLVFRFRLLINIGATEGECLLQVESSQDFSGAAFFQRLTAAWQGMAYGHSLPSTGELEALCRDWDRVFGELHEE